MEVYLIRHTTPLVEKDICYGQSELPLADSFDAETGKLLSHLPELLDAVYSSPVNRCYQLARLIQCNRNVIIDKRLIEMNFGDWEMKKWDDIDQKFLNGWMKNFVNVRVPNGESFSDLDKRVNAFIDELVKTNIKQAAIVSHAGVIRSIVARVLEMPLTNAFKIPYEYCSVTKIHLNGDNCLSKIEYFNRH